MKKLLIVAACAVLLQACGGSRRAKDASGRGAAAAGPQAGMAMPGETQVTEASLRGKTFVESPNLAVVRFDYDRAALSAEAQGALRKNADWLKAHPGVEIQIQGHCDERGTVEYNLALGQRRASAVRDYYRSLGIASRRMSTISFGKEQPACAESSEACWSRNRRAETRARLHP